MATAVRAHDDGGKAAPSSVAEDGNHHRLPLEASLRQMKFASGGYLNNPNGVTDSKFLSASHDHARSLRSAGLSKQAGQTRKIFRDFRIADQPKKQRIVECLAQTLVRTRQTVHVSSFSFVSCATDGGDGLTRFPRVAVC